MATSEERIKILKMLEEGKLSVEEASRLLKVLSKGKPEGQRVMPEGEAKWLRVRVTELASKKTKVNISLPMSLVTVGVRLAAPFIPDDEGSELNEISDSLREALDSGMVGKVVDVVDEEEGYRVEIYVE